MSKYVGLVLECTRRDGGDVETFICADYEPGNRHYTLIPTAGRLCRQHMVVLNAGGWKVRGSRNDVPLIRRTIEKLEAYVRCSNADPMSLPSSCSVAGKNITLLQRLVKQQDQTTFDPVCEKGCPEAVQSAPRPSLSDLVTQMNHLSTMERLVEKMKLCGKLAFIEFPIDDPDRVHSGEYIVIEQTADRLYCVSTACLKTGVAMAQITVHSDDPTEKVAQVVRHYEDQAYITRFISTLEELSRDTDNDPVTRDRADNIATQLRRVMKRVYPEVVQTVDLFGKFNSRAAETMSIQQLLGKHDPFACDDRYQPSDASLPI